MIVSLIAATTTTSGLTVQAALDTDPYPNGIRITDEQMQTPAITRTTSTAAGTTRSSPGPTPAQGR